jgi:hypothetical protein
VAALRSQFGGHSVRKPGQGREDNQK